MIILKNSLKQFRDHLEAFLSILDNLDKLGPFLVPKVLQHIFNIISYENDMKGQTIWVKLIRIGNLPSLCYFLSVCMGTLSQNEPWNLILFSSRLLHFSEKLEKWPPYGPLFTSSCGGLQPSAATMGSFKPSFAFSAKKKFNKKKFWQKNVLAKTIQFFFYKKK